ncbi:hypothetical protein GGE68_004833 [Rhizobium leguminosarum]|nr:hypothetical protein [Rhizobium leguminosarum]
MPKITLTCEYCAASFEKWPSAIRYAEANGTFSKFCSRACVGKARSDGSIEAKRKRGSTLVCEACGNGFYRTVSDIKAGRSRFCSEPCRQQGFRLKLIDKSAPRPQNLRGKTITCVVCGDQAYRKKSMIERNIDKTCGDPKCVSAYGRSMWGLEPYSEEEFLKPRPRRRYRTTNFTPLQRKKWLGTECAHCGSNSNLTLDHIIPCCAGGTNVQENAQTLCGRCNNIKAATTDRLLARKQTSGGGCKS